VVERQLESLRVAVERLTMQQQPMVHDTTPAALGDRTVAVLHAAGRVEDFVGDGGAAVLDAGQQQSLASCTREAQVVARLTPVLWRLRVASHDSDDACRPVLVNSENHVWLDNLTMPLRPGSRLKPDLFVAPHVCVERHEGSSSQGSGDGFIFGRLADHRLQRDGCVRELYEAKLGPLTLACLGELVMYHRLIPGECRGMLFNGTQFWLFASFDGHPIRLVRSTWVTPGSADCVRRFFEDQAPPPPRLVPVLRQLLSELRLRPWPHAVAAGSAFLGGGGSGRVFAVQRVAPEDASDTPPTRLALKVVPATGALWWSNLAAEFQAMQAAAARDAPVVPVVADSLRLVGLDGGGFLLARCGVPFDATRSAAACTAAFTSLAALHACGVVHGDARLANVVLLDGRAAWLDLAPGPPDGADAATFAVYCALDAETLAQSVLRAAGVLASPLPSAVTAALASYDAAAEHTVHALAAAVWAVAHPAG